MRASSRTSLPSNPTIITLLSTLLLQMILSNSRFTILRVGSLSGSSLQHAVQHAVSHSSPSLSLLRPFSTSKPPKEPLVITTTTPSGITTLRMNNPKKLNGWTEPMLLSLFSSFQSASSNPSTKAVIITGTGSYYCAGVDLSGTIKPMPPSKLHDMIYTSNKKVFDTFLKFPKPIIGECCCRGSV